MIAVASRRSPASFAWPVRERLACASLTAGQLSFQNKGELLRYGLEGSGLAAEPLPVIHRLPCSDCPGRIEGRVVAGSRRAWLARRPSLPIRLLQLAPALYRINGSE